MLGFLRCTEISLGVKSKIKMLFLGEHKWVTILFLWTMLTMGSGTAFVGLAILSLYFIDCKTAIYIAPLLIGLFFLGQAMGLREMDRAVRVARAAITGDANHVIEKDGSAAARVAPIINTFKTDLTLKESWVGKGTLAVHHMWNKNSTKISVIEQYGLLSFFISLILLYTCCIHKFTSLETLMFLLLDGFSLGNIYHTWAIVMIFTGVFYFQKMNKQGTLVIELEYR